MAKLRGAGMSDVTSVVLEVRPLPDEDVDELAAATRMLSVELRESEVDSVGPLPAARAPEHAKGLGECLGWLLVDLPANVGALAALSQALIGWAGRTRRVIELTVDGDTLKITSASSAQADLALHAFLERHGAG